jgi:hypothetical protein
MALELVAKLWLDQLEIGQHIAHRVGHQDPWCTPTELRLTDPMPAVEGKAGAEIVGCRWPGFAGDYCHRVNHSLELPSGAIGEICDNVKRCCARQSVPDGSSVPRAPDLGRDEHSNYSGGGCQLQPAFEEGNGKIGTVSIGACASSPPAIAAGKPVSKFARNLFGSQPRRIAKHDVEATSCKDIGEVTLIVKPGQISIARQSAPGVP